MDVNRYLDWLHINKQTTEVNSNTGEFGASEYKQEPVHQTRGKRFKPG